MPRRDKKINDLYHRSAAIVDLNCISHNLKIIKEKAPGKKIIAMVKANAYGHGIIRVAEHLESEGVDYIGTAFIEEAIALRNVGISIPIITSAPFSKYQISWYIENDIDFTVASIYSLNNIDNAANFFGKKVNIHLKIDTGMMRVGIRYSNAEKLLKAALSAKNCRVVSIFSHFSTADEENLDFSYIQLERFLKVTDFYKKNALEKPLFQIANSAAILRMNESHLDMVRAGLMLYGYHPSVYSKSEAILKPSLSLRSKVIYFKVILKGNFVGYGKTWKAEKNCRAVTIPIGYGDGYSRRFSNNSWVLIRGQKYPIIGNIGMDQSVVCIDDGEAYIGDEVILIGSQGEKEITADDLAKKIGTINYEILTNISHRVPRIYLP